jgi:hypothetical protein
VSTDLALPAALVEAHEPGFDYNHGDGVDFEPYDEFMDAAETAQWWRAWTGNPDVDGVQFRVFGQDGTGGMAAFWLVRPGADIGEQPVVFLGSEGAAGVVARDLASYLWLLAAGLGPMEVVEYSSVDDLREQDPDRTAVALRHAPSAQQPPSAIVAAAREEFPNFAADVAAQCR